jgi:FkbM family methyltransferase
LWLDTTIKRCFIIFFNQFKRPDGRAVIGGKLILSSAGSLAAVITSSRLLQKTLFNAARLNRPEFSRLWARNDLRFLSYVFARRHLSKSQILQDLWVCFELDEKRDGFFVEFGATNGITNSNTWLLEKEFGWTGILAEPNPYWHSDLGKNRQTFIDHKCVSSKSGETVAFLATDSSDPELSGMQAFADGDHFKSLREKGKAIQVQTTSLNDLLLSHNAPTNIDYLSIDTEGSELDLLLSFDFERYRISLISVEQNPATEGPIQNLLKSKGYSRVYPQFSQWDGWYVSNELKTAPPPEIYAPAA